MSGISAAVVSGDVTALRAASNYGVDVTALDEETSRSLLHTLASHVSNLPQDTDLQQYVQVAKLLVDQGVYIDGQDSDGNTPLHLAIGGCRANLVLWLLAHQASVDIVNREGETASMRANRLWSEEAERKFVPEVADQGRADQLLAMAGEEALLWNSPRDWTRTDRFSLTTATTLSLLSLLVHRVGSGRQLVDALSERWGFHVVSVIKSSTGHCAVWQSVDSGQPALVFAFAATCEENSTPSLSHDHDGQGIREDIFAMGQEILPRIEHFPSLSRTPVFLTGHGVGGALANVVMHLLAQRGVDDSRLVMYTFGQPRVGTEEFQRRFDQQFPHAYTVQRFGDSLCHTPLVSLEGLAMVHCGSLRYLDANGQLGNDTHYQFEDIGRTGRAAHTRLYVCTPADWRRLWTTTLKCLSRWRDPDSDAPASSSVDSTPSTSYANLATSGQSQGDINYPMEKSPSSYVELIGTLQQRIRVPFSLSEQPERAICTQFLDINVPHDTLKAPGKRERHEREKREAYKEWAGKYTRGYALHPSVNVEDIVEWVTCEGMVLNAIQESEERLLRDYPDAEWQGLQEPSLQGLTPMVEEGFHSILRQALQVATGDHKDISAAVCCCERVYFLLPSRGWRLVPAPASTQESSVPMMKPIRDGSNSTYRSGFLALLRSYAQGKCPELLQTAHNLSSGGMTTLSRSAVLEDSRLREQRERTENQVKAVEARRCDRIAALLRPMVMGDRMSKLGRAYENLQEGKKAFLCIKPHHLKSHFSREKNYREDDQIRGIESKVVEILQLISRVWSALSQPRGVGTLVEQLRGNRLIIAIEVLNGAFGSLALHRFDCMGAEDAVLAEFAASEFLSKMMKKIEATLLKGKPQQSLMLVFSGWISTLTRTLLHDPAGFREPLRRHRLPDDGVQSYQLLKSCYAQWMNRLPAGNRSLKARGMMLELKSLLLQERFDDWKQAVQGGALNKYVRIEDSLLHWLAHQSSSEHSELRQRKYTEVAELLLQHGYDINGLDSQGSTPLHLAVGSGKPEFLLWLIANKADLSPEDLDKAYNLLSEDADDQGLVKLPTKERMQRVDGLLAYLIPQTQATKEEEQGAVSNDPWNVFTIRPPLRWYEPDRFSLPTAQVMAMICRLTYFGEGDDENREASNDLPRAFAKRWDMELTNVHQVGAARMYLLRIPKREDRPTVNVVAVRGSKANRDWVADALFFNKKINSSDEFDTQYNVHMGFCSYADKLWPGLLQILQQNGDTNAPLYLTGHSLGGAVITLLSHRLCMNNPDRVIMYTFGQPRVGKVPFRDDFEKQVPRAYIVQRFGDEVPHLPSNSGVLGYNQFWHCGNLRYLDYNGQLFNDNYYRFVDIARTTRMPDESCLRRKWTNSFRQLDQFARANCNRAALLSGEANENNQITQWNGSSDSAQSPTRIISSSGEVIGPGKSRHSRIMQLFSPSSHSSLSDSNGGASIQVRANVHHNARYGIVKRLQGKEGHGVPNYLGDIYSLVRRIETDFSWQEHPEMAICTQLLNVELPPDVLILTTEKQKRDRADRERTRQEHARLYARAVLQRELPAGHSQLTSWVDSESQALYAISEMETLLAREVPSFGQLQKIPTGFNDTNQVLTPLVAQGFQTIVTQVSRFAQERPKEAARYCKLAHYLMPSGGWELVPNEDTWIVKKSDTRTYRGEFIKMLQSSAQSHCLQQVAYDLLTGVDAMYLGQICERYHDAYTQKIQALQATKSLLATYELNSVNGLLATDKSGVGRAIASKIITAVVKKKAAQIGANKVVHKISQRHIAHSQDVLNHFFYLIPASDRDVLRGRIREMMNDFRDREYMFPVYLLNSACLNYAIQKYSALDFSQRSHDEAIARAIDSLFVRLRAMFASHLSPAHAAIVLKETKQSDSDLPSGLFRGVADRLKQSLEDAKSALEDEVNENDGEAAFGIQQFHHLESCDNSLRSVIKSALDVAPQ